MFSILSMLKRINEFLAIAAGLLLALAVVITLYDIIARPFHLSLGGTEEFSGYAMAIATSWGISYALTSMAHVRIDLLRSRCLARGRAIFDTIAILALAYTALTVAYRVWPVLATTLRNDSTANTPLETPLWIPQSLWFAGWTWFAISATIIALSVLIMLVTGKYDEINDAAGLRGEA